MKSYGGGQVPQIKTGREPGRDPERTGSTLLHGSCPETVLEWRNTCYWRFFSQILQFSVECFSSDPSAILSLAPLPQDNTGMTVWFVWKRQPKNKF